MYKVYAGLVSLWQFSSVSDSLSYVKPIKLSSQRTNLAILLAYETLALRLSA